jgi:hypothetical protein
MSIIVMFSLHLVISFVHLFAFLIIGLGHVGFVIDVPNPVILSHLFTSYRTSLIYTSIWIFFPQEYGSEGSTACVVLIRDNEIIVGNVGDSQCLLFVNGQVF